MCDNDGGLRSRAEELIRAAEQEDGFLEPPAGRTAAGPAASIGAYRTLGALGSGGMGTVYEAERSDPQRRVALKVMRHAWADPSTAARFKHEVEVLASLRHPGIATLYEAGVADDVPWFAMELVEEGRPIPLHLRQSALGLREVETLSAPGTTGRTAPQWSPSGELLAFRVYDRDARGYFILVVHTDGSGGRRLVQVSGLGGRTIDWSPEGKQIAFMQTIHVTSEPGTYVMDADPDLESSTARLGSATPEGNWDSIPRFSPDGTRLVWARYFPTGDPNNPNGEIFTARVDGTDLRRLTDNEILLESDPDW